MSEYDASANRVLPYKNFKFRIKWDGDYVAGVTKVSPLRRTTATIEHRDGGDPSRVYKTPGQTSYEPVTLERGVTHDPKFEEWASMVWQLDSGLGSEVSLKDFRKDVTIEMFNEAGQLVLAYTLHRAWVSEYQAIPDLDASASAIAIQTLKLEHDGWQRDTAIEVPQLPSL